MFSTQEREKLTPKIVSIEHTGTTVSDILTGLSVLTRPRPPASVPSVLLLLPKPSNMLPKPSDCPRSRSVSSSLGGVAVLPLA